MVDDLKRILEKLGLIILNFPLLRLLKYRYRYNIFDSIHKEATKDSVRYIYENASNSVMLGNRKLLFKFILYEYVKNTDYKNKLFLEFGTYKGESINLCSKLMPEVNFYGFDTFEGLSESFSI